MPGPVPVGRFKSDPTFIPKIKRTREYKDCLKEIMHGALGVAIVIAPRGPTQRYYRKFVVVEEHGEIRFGNTDFKAHWIEWGTVKMKGQHVLTRAVEIAGIKLDVDQRP